MARINEDDLIKRIRNQLEQDPTVEDPMQIDLLVERRGVLFNRNTVVSVSGRIKNDAEGRKIEETVRSALPTNENVQVENNLVVPLV